MSDLKTPNASSHGGGSPQVRGRTKDVDPGDAELRDDQSGRDSGLGGGDSGGGAYPNPHRGKEAGEGGFMGHGGQMPYHGSGQLGEQVIEGNENATARKGGADEDEDRDA